MRWPIWLRVPHSDAEDLLLPHGSGAVFRNHREAEPLSPSRYSRSAELARLPAPAAERARHSAILAAPSEEPRAEAPRTPGCPLGEHRAGAPPATSGFAEVTGSASRR